MPIAKKAYGRGTLLRDLILSTTKATYVTKRERRMKQFESTENECYEKLTALLSAIWKKSNLIFIQKVIC